MVAKVNPLRIGSDGRDRETDPSSEYLSAKGLAFEGLDTHLAEKIGDVLGLTKPDFSCAPNFNANGTLNYLEYFLGATQTLANRRARVDMTYDANFDPATEVWKIYSPSDGTTILRTITYTYTFVASVLTNVVEATT